MSPQVFSHEPMSFKRLPPALKALIVANVVVFLMASIVGNSFFDLFGLVPKHVLVDRWVWQPLTYLFVHGSIMHLLLNLFALWMFGLPVEAQWGARDFLKYYFICGLGAAAASLALSPHSMAPVIGASGAVYGLLVAFAMLYPDAVVYLYFLIPVKAAHVAILFGLVEFFSGATNATPGIARFAHLGGMITGYLYLRWWWVLKIRAKAFWRDSSFIGGAVKPGMRRTVFKAQGVENTEKQEKSAMDEVDHILDKILVSGLNSLTEAEKSVMRRYSDQSQKKQ
jgi:membrane associated rhomboid family serine protease